MIDLYFWTTPNGYKPMLMLEELGVPYDVKMIDIGAGDQFEAEFLKIAPNNRIPAIVDHEPLGGGAPISIFESGAILIYLAEKYGAFLPKEGSARAEVLQWLMWQMGGLGPMAGQAHHFLQYAPEDVPYGKQRYSNECNRLYGVLDRRLADRAFVAGDEYTIADMAIWPWAIHMGRQGQDKAAFAKVSRWIDEIGQRPATLRSYEKGKALNEKPTVDEKSARVLFNQTAAVLNHKDE